MISVRPLDAPFGAEITGIDLSEDALDSAVKPIVDALHENRFVVIRDQALDTDRYMAFGEQFGTPIPHVLDHLRMRGYPAIMEVGNTEKQHRKEAVRNGAVFWHTDQSYEAEPSSATMLYAIKVPKQGGETLIADLAGAYDALDDETKERIDGLVVKHLYGAASGRGDEKIASPLINEEQVEKVPPVHHRLVRPHPVTGRKTLYAVAGTCYGIVGMDDEEAQDLLAELKEHALQDRFIYKHKYDLGDIAIWDTSATLHSGTSIDFADSEENSRLLYRISVRGKPRVYQ